MRRCAPCIRKWARLCKRPDAPSCTAFASMGAMMSGVGVPRSAAICGGPPETSATVGNGGMTNDEYRTHMSLWCLLAAPLLAGNDLSSMTEETREILMNTEVIAINQDQAANPAKLVTPLGKHVVAYRKLSDGSTAVAFFNRDDKEDEIGVEWSAVEIEGRNIRARDLWKHEALKVSPTHYSARVPAHGVVMLRVKPRS